MTESLEPITVEDLVRQHAPELIPHSDPAISVAGQIAVFLLTSAVTVPVLVAMGVHAVPVTLISAGIAGVLGGAGARWLMYREQRAQTRRFAKELKASPWTFYEAVALKFAAEVERQRARTIGPSSEWGRARLKLESAEQVADRSVAYWTQRAATEPDIAQPQLAAATRLRDKFHTALSDLDQRARVLVKFFNDCEARVAVLQSAKRDYEEISKLEALADRSDEIVSEAEGTLVSIGTSFVEEALRVAKALGSLERVGLISLAGETSVDQLETLADRILESGERDRRALEHVAESI